MSEASAPAPVRIPESARSGTLLDQPDSPSQQKEIIIPTGNGAPHTETNNVKLPTADASDQSEAPPTQLSTPSGEPRVPIEIPEEYFIEPHGGAPTKDSDMPPVISRDEVPPGPPMSDTEVTGQEPTTETTAKPKTLDEMPLAPEVPAVGSTLASSVGEYKVVDVKEGQVTVSQKNPDGTENTLIWDKSTYEGYRTSGRLKEAAPAVAKVEEALTAAESADADELVDEGGMAEAAEAFAAIDPKLARDALLMIKEGKNQIFSPITADEVAAAREDVQAKVALTDRVDLQIGMMTHQANLLQKKGKTPDAKELMHKVNKLKAQRDSGEFVVRATDGTESTEAKIENMPENRVAKTTAALARKMNNDSVADEIDKNPDMSFSAMSAIFESAVKNQHDMESLMTALKDMNLAEGIDSVGAAIDDAHRHNRHKKMMYVGGGLVGTLLLLAAAGIKKGLRENNSSGGVPR